MSNLCILLGIASAVVFLWSWSGTTDVVRLFPLWEGRDFRHRTGVAMFPLMPFFFFLYFVVAPQRPPFFWVMVFVFCFLVAGGIVTYLYFADPKRVEHLTIEQLRENLKREPLPTGRVFEQKLREAYLTHMRSKGGRMLLEPYLDQLIAALREIYEDEFLRDNPRLLEKAVDPDGAYMTMFLASFHGLVDMTTAVPDFVRQRIGKPTTSVFTLPLYDQLIQYDDTKKVHKDSEVGTYTVLPQFMGALWALGKPFRDEQLFKERGLFDWTKTSHQVFATGPYPSDYSNKREYEKERKEYEEARAYAEAHVWAWEQPFLHTPLHKYAQKLLPNEGITVPFDIPAETRFDGTWIIAPSGRGKTTLLHTLFMHDYFENHGCTILMDSKGDLIDPIKRLDIDPKTVVLIEPDEALALNPLAIGTRSIHTIDMLEYLFSTLLGAKITPLQSTLFRSVLRALIENIPNPTIDTFRNIIVNGIEPYERHITSPDLKEFFVKEFPTATYAETKQQIVSRLRRLLENPVIRGMFCARENKLKIGELMNQRKLIIINNSKALLGEDGAEFFGRFFIALIVLAAQARAHLSQEKKNPVYFYIDECHVVMKRDENVATIFDECRSQKIALILAYQRLEQISAPVLDAMANCAIRFANSDEEASDLAPRLRTTPEHLRSLEKGTFALFVRDLTKQAMTLNIPLSNLLTLPTRLIADQEALTQRMRQQYGSSTPRAYSEPPLTLSRMSEHPR